MAPLPEAETVDPVALLDAWRRGDIDLVCVLGPTASGKTRYAVGLARELNRLQAGAEILSADSRQVYRGMDIGTGKDLAEYGEVPYHLIDIVPAGAKYNIYQYQEAFAQAYAGVLRRGAVPILCGGSGLYIESVTRSYKFGKENGLPPERLPRKTYYIGTLVTREERVARIDRRLEERLQEGLVEEVDGQGMAPDPLQGCTGQPIGPVGVSPLVQGASHSMSRQVHEREREQGVIVSGCEARSRKAQP